MDPKPLGCMPHPQNFKYEAVLRHGKPRHEPFDDFRRKHPSMPPEKRAKLFMPFDALRGFDLAIRKKQEIQDG